ncbi:protein kinase, putative [Perkinsus marinus ATCC 50983]|uniref:Protein kinase, putative n=1 Tax=Perkinsus marinus (strain ATCC 50983 / TXsc) TaxID=423536 RepID=C5KXQ9_PERM5|nr:protein kinase, putative [Perkinsus marinus ATCC 50983]EER10783.1 protein kinase, putative [Perkinsus marinus ATCC 50983]|eukprot:XP_002778988.1 protein kinase, putative [Perkinsus marinus ATCC 50983]
MVLSPTLIRGLDAQPPDAALHGITLDDLVKVTLGHGGGLSGHTTLSDSDDYPPRPVLARNTSLRDIRKDEKKLGKGSFGEVLCVKIRGDPSGKGLVAHRPSQASYTGRLYALKTLRKRDVEQGHLAAQVEREISVQSRLPAHSNILRLYSHFEDREHVYLLLEYCAKGELYHLLRTQQKRRFPVERAARYFLMAARAVAHLHSHGIMHRDIKPENLLVAADDTLKLADFGWCAEFPAPVVSGYTTRSHARRHTFCGTLDYLSPEMLLGRGHDHSIDLWGLGILLYELLAGRPPFNATDQRTVVSNIINVK